MKFGENLKLIRKSKKISQEELAEKLGISRQSVSKWETGENYPSMNNIMCLCDIFKCNINELVHEDFIDINFLDDEIKMSVVKFKKEKQKKMKGLSKAIYIFARIGKIVVTIAIPIMIVVMIIAPMIINKVNVVDNEIIFGGVNDRIIITEENLDNKITLKVNDLIVSDENNQNTIMIMKNVLEHNSKISIICYVEMGMLCLVICLVLYRMILKHLEDLFVNINNGDTPFTLENVNHIKQMAYFMIVTIILPNISGAIFELLLKSDLDIGFEMFDVIEILFLFSMAYIFEYGYEIQLDSKGKIYGDENE